MKKLFLILFTVSIFAGCTGQRDFLRKPDNSFEPKVKLGIEVLRDNNFDILKGKRVGLVTNATGVDGDLKSTVDILAEADEVNLVALFGPEHGVRGDFPAGEYVDFYIDEFTKLPVYSLYGKTRKPNTEMLEGLDVLVYDIQDNGARSYTYISTMGLVMEAAAENNIEVVVLDRPNPLGGNRVEGNLVEDEYISFVSQFKIPYVYGLTAGELARMLKGESMLSGGLDVNLQVVPMKGWSRDMVFEDTGLEWVPTSPHIPHKNSPYYYVVSGIIGELGVMSIGVGYTIPFETFAADWIDPNLLAKEMNNLGLEGVIFRPITYKPFYAFGKGEEMSGVQIHLTNPSKVNLMSLQFYFMQVNHKLYPDKDLFELAKSNRIRMFDKVAGSDEVRKRFTKNFKYEDIEEMLNRDAERFKNFSKRYYLY